MRDRDNLIPQYLNDYRKGRQTEQAILARLVRLKEQPIERKFFCQVCRQPIPNATAERMGVLCGKDCREEMRSYRLQILKNQKCPRCYHPSSPKEWELYRQFRLWLAKQKGGGMQAFMQAPGRGNKSWKQQKELRDALSEAMVVLRAAREDFFPRQWIKTMEGVQYRKAIDAIRQEGLDECSARIERFEGLLGTTKLTQSKKIVDREGTE